MQLSDLVGRSIRIDVMDDWQCNGANQVLTRSDLVGRDIRIDVMGNWHCNGANEVLRRRIPEKRLRRDHVTKQ